MAENTMLVWFIIIFIAVGVEIYYWFVYVPKAWRTPGINREIDDIRLAYEAGVLLPHDSEDEELP